MRRYKLYLTFLLLTGFFPAFSQQKESRKEIHFIVIDDKMSMRRYETGPIPAGYNKGFTDSLRYCRVEFYEQGNVVREEHYSTVGALYYSKENSYDEKGRVIRSVRINEYEDDTCRVSYSYKDSLDLLTEEDMVQQCKEESRFSFRYTYNEQKANATLLGYSNDVLISRDSMFYPDSNEKIVVSYDQDNQLTKYHFRYNDHNDIIYTKKTRTHTTNGKPEEMTETYEYVYKYDLYGNYTERIKQTYCPPKAAPARVRHDKKSKRPYKGPPRVAVVDGSDCYPELSENIVRRIYYR